MTWPGCGRSAIGSARRRSSPSMPMARMRRPMRRSPRSNSCFRSTSPWRSSPRRGTASACSPRSAVACRCRSWPTRRSSRRGIWRRPSTEMRSTSCRSTPGRTAASRTRWPWPGGCRRRGRCCAIGSNLETDLGQAAMVCLASCLSAFPVERYACDLQAALFYEPSSVSPPMAYRDGRVQLPSGPGFGVVPRSAPGG